MLWRGQLGQNDREVELNADGKREWEETGGLLGGESPLQTPRDVDLGGTLLMPAGAGGG